MDNTWRIRDFFPDLGDEALAALRLFHVELIRLNQSLNLISGFSEKNSDILHFFDSITAALHIIKENKGEAEIFDLGGGNGLPGLIIAILNPSLKVRVIEEDIRKMDFVKHMVARLELKNVDMLLTPPEKLNIPKKAVVVCRNYKNLARTLLLGNKIFKKGTIIYSLKGDDWFAEFGSLPSQISSTWNNEMNLEYELPQNLGTKVIIKSIKTN